MISPSVELFSLYEQNCPFYNNQKNTSQIQALCPTGSGELEKCKSFYCSCKNDIHGVHGVRAIFTRLPSLIIKIIGRLSVTYFDVVNTVFAGAKNLPPCYKAL
jgi:hypothetical protein